MLEASFYLQDLIRPVSNENVEFIFSDIALKFVLCTNSSLIDISIWASNSTSDDRAIS